MKSIQVQCGYLPLVDSAPLIIAKELKFAAQEGLDLTLQKQPSWSALRDRLAFGHIDFAHMLSPMPIAMSLGLGGLSNRIDALMVMSVNGTVIGVSSELNQKMSGAGWENTFDNPKATSKALLAVSDRPLRIGVPFPFSMHRMLLETWLTQDPVFSPDRIEIVTVPPPQMAQAVTEGALDVFCVGEPWGSVALQHSDASLILPGSSIWEFAPEKVLGVRHEWAEENPTACRAMIRALYKAARWLNLPENTPLAVEILARSQHLDLPDHAIDPALTGRIATRSGHDAKPTAGFLNFHDKAANFPWRSQASWISDVISRWHGLDRDASRKIARACFRSDLYREALAPLGVNLPGASEKVEGAMATSVAVASTMGQMILGPDRFFSGATFDFEGEE
ncbi:CmpA/NrtA family ABC transporter substrate-binding protein [Octadecabacter sp. 1_MG-2023]|uniref:CmpA/NrtA family ABC transporter substrate-binding protein n=1 Tax=unclassified Octadecabacter TaxID=196158 RepID=UPI001C083B85|nr:MULTISPECIES: CmpA/NrtA family ABC transporter substrate-binding protein [unclassified Octadecabacter]MBU2994767.1 ABC transporter substrate-binding protein [Octadecabacter sp. B2R22]MDO6733939.1 CmpA/NrtA family ABC transporter substrate-binding protein [Octadecabacter sp. 1_MG-2023]